MSRILLLLCLLVLGALPAWCQETESRTAYENVLAKQGIGTEVDELLLFLEQLRPADKQLRRFADLIQQLGDDDFRKREQATSELARAGPSVRAQLVEASKGHNVEIRWRAKRLLADIETRQQQQLRDELVTAVLRLLELHASERAVGPLLAAIPSLDESHHGDAACEAIWASTGASHEDRMRQALTHEHANVRAAAVVGLELAVGDAAVAQLRPYLNSDAECLRLAAARSLLNHLPRESIRVLITLLGANSDAVRWQAAVLLEMLSGRTEEADGDALAEKWNTWADEQLASAKLKIPLDRQSRLDLSRRRTVVESFQVDAKEIVSRYGRFQYESQVGASAEVSGGILSIHGNRGGDGDQSLSITAQRLFNRRELPKRFSIETAIGGQSIATGTWHVGLAVGKLRILFHPGYSGGAFRVEQTGSRAELIANTNMGFTPAGEALHGMTIDVEQSGDRVEFRVTVTDSNDKTGATKYTRQFTAPRSTAGELDRLALERSGRQGGNALFGFLKVTAR